MYTTNEKALTREELQRLLQNIDHARIGLIGDLCLDMYWLADMKLSELSRETPHYPLPVVEERTSPGGAGNVANNIAALEPERFLVVGLVGNDAFAVKLVKNGVNTRHIKVVGVNLVCGETDQKFSAVTEFKN